MKRDRNARMRGFYGALARAAELMRDVGFLKVLIPVLCVVGVSLFGTWAVRGFVQQRTYVLARLYGGGVGYGEVTGPMAIVVAAIHLVLAGGIGAVLGPLSYFLWSTRP